MPRRSSQVFCNPCAHRFDFNLKRVTSQHGQRLSVHPQPAVAHAKFAQPQKRRNEDVYTMTPHSINPAYQGVIRRSVESAEMNRGMTNSGLGRCGAYRTPSHRPSRNWIRFRSSRPLPRWEDFWRPGSNRASKAERCRAGQDGDLLARPECLRRVPVRYSPIWINTTQHNGIAQNLSEPVPFSQNFLEGDFWPRILNAVTHDLSSQCPSLYELRSNKWGVPSLTCSFPLRVSFNPCRKHRRAKVTSSVRKGIEFTTR